MEMGESKIIIIFRLYYCNQEKIKQKLLKIRNCKKVAWYSGHENVPLRSLTVSLTLINGLWSQLLCSEIRHLIYIKMLRPGFPENSSVWQKY